MDWFFFGGERTLDDGKSADYRIQISSLNNPLF